MEYAFYDSSWTVYGIPKLTGSLSGLLLAPPATSQARDDHRARLEAHADSFNACLGKDRPRYEIEEENMRLGGLKQCMWTRLEQALDQDVPAQAGTKRKRATREDEEHPQCHGILISLIYEKKTYKFIIYTSSSLSTKRNRTTSIFSNNSTAALAGEAVLLSKSSPTALKALIEYLTSTFSLPSIHPLQFPSQLLQTTLERYLTTTYTSIFADNSPALSRALFKSAIGTLKLSISFFAPIAPKLKSLEISIPPETVLSMCERNITQRAAHGTSASTLPIDSTFMNTLAGFIMKSAGLSIPVLSKVNADFTDWAYRAQEEQSDEPPDLPMRVTRVNTGAYAMGVDSRLKFVRKAVDGVDGEGEENCIRRANWEVLGRVVEEVRRQARDQEDDHDDGNGQPS